MTRKDKWNYIAEEVIKSIDSIETPDIETKIMKLNIIFNLARMIETEEKFNNILDILNKNKERILVKRK